MSHPTEKLELIFLVCIECTANSSSFEDIQYEATTWKNTTEGFVKWLKTYLYVSCYIWEHLKMYIVTFFILNKQFLCLILNFVYFFL